MTRLSLGATPRKPQMPTNQNEADFDWRLGGGTFANQRAWA